MNDEHGHCPNCKADMNGALIWRTFIERGMLPGEADEKAAMYGATRTKGRWGLQIAIYDMGRDRTTAWQCPYCSETWPRQSHPA